MNISIDLIHHHLKKYYNTSLLKNDSKTSFCSFRIYNSGTPQPGHLYIIRADQLAFIDSTQNNLDFLCIGVKNAPDYQAGFNVLFLNDFIDYLILVNQLTDIFDYYNRWDKELDACGTGLEGIRKMTWLSQDILRGSIILPDYHFRYLAYTHDFDENISRIQSRSNGQTPYFVVDELLTDPEYFQVQTTRDFFDYQIHDGQGMVPALCYNIFSKYSEGYRARVLFVPHQPPYGDDQKFLILHYAGKIEKLLEQISDFAMPFPSSVGLQDAIVKSISSRNIAPTLLRSTLQFVDWDYEDTYLLLKFDPAFLSAPKEINAVSRNQLELMIPESCAAVYENGIILVVNLSRNEKIHHLYQDSIYSKLPVFLRESMYKAGISNPFTGFARIKTAYEEAVAALNLGTVHDNMFWYYRFSDYAFEYMLEKCTEVIPARNLCLQELLKLIDYDKANETSYTQALKTYIDCKFNVTHAAETLFLHRTTLLKHLKKIDDITNLDLDSWRTRLHLMLSFQLLDK